MKVTQIEFQFSFTSLKSGSFSPFVIRGKLIEALLILSREAEVIFLAYLYKLFYSGQYLSMGHWALIFYNFSVWPKLFQFPLCGLCTDYVCLPMPAFQEAPCFGTQQLLTVGMFFHTIEHSHPHRSNNSKVLFECWVFFSVKQKKTALKYQICQAYNAVRIKH